MTDDDWLDIYDPDPSAETADAADEFLHRHRDVANDNPTAFPAYFRLRDSYHFMTAQELFDLQQRAWQHEVENDLHNARWEATDQGVA